MDPPILGNADRELAAAYVQAAHEAKQRDRGARSVTVERYAITVGVRRLDEDEAYKRYRGAAVFQLVSRIDVLGAERLGLEVDPRRLDLWFGEHERGIDCLFFDWDGYRAPFPAKDWHLAIDTTVNPGDPWADHILTKGRFRLYVWTIGPCWSILLGYRRRKK